jgi:uncharacterized membrane protein YkoI
MKRIILGIAAALPLAAAADKLECTVKANKRMSQAELTAAAKVKEADARKTALESLKAPQAASAKGGLGVEDGCLVYAYDVLLPGRPSQEVIIDAGTGEIITKKAETK